MRVKTMMAVLLAGCMSLSANAGFEQFSDPVGSVNVFNISGVYQYTISPFGVADLRSITTDNRTFELLPNINLYDDNPGDPAWRNNGGAGPDGNAIVEADTLFEISSLTADITSASITFSVDALNINLSRYQVKGFIKVLNPDAGYSESAKQEISIGTTGGPYTLQIATAGLSGQLLQAGWSVKGLNANPTNDWGSVTVTVTNLNTVSVDFAAPTPNPMGFAVEPYAISSNAITMTASNATDNIYGVEYFFTNTTANTFSGWQSSPTWVDNGPTAGSPTTNVVDKIIDPTFLDLNGNWNGYNGGSVDPSSFITVSGGVATVTPGSTAEWDFYQELVDVLEAGKTYELSIVSDNSTLAGGGSAVAFVKAFGPGYAWKAGEYQTTALSLDGSATTITIPAQAGTTIYQVGVSTMGATSGSYDVSNPKLTTTEVVPFSAGLTPGEVYDYKVKARDTSPNQNETDWSPLVSAIAEVTDTNAPTPDPMAFAVEPFAISDTAISMTASNAVDDAFGVEYLFTNTVNGTSSGWQSSPAWVESGDLSLTNADFENSGDAGAGWTFDNGDVSGAGTTNISANTSALTYANGGWAVAVQAITNIATKGFSGGDDVTFSVEARALAGLNGGGAILKMESWSGGSQIDTSGDVSISPTENWDSYSMPYTIAAGADEVRIVVGTVLYPAGPTAGYYLFDNVAVTKAGGLSAGTEYTYRVKARDTSPNKNETGWSGLFSATTTGLAPVVPFDVQAASITAGQAIFSWDGVAGRTYGLEYTTNLVTGPWLPDPSLGATNIVSAGGAMSATSTVDAVSIFYRISAE